MDIHKTNLRFAFGDQFNSALNEDRTLLQLGALFENNHKINQPHVEEPDKDKEPDASGEPDKDKEPDASGEPEKTKNQMQVANQKKIKTQMQVANQIKTKKQNK